MNWFHEVSKEWLMARQGFLTASDIITLLPMSPTGRKRNVSKFYLEVWAKKQTTITEDSIKSFGRMARGHLLEPYAIRSFNQATGLQLQHIDDQLIYADHSAYSPDALDIYLPKDIRPTVSTQHVKPTILGEVKSYEADKHYTTAKADKMSIEERWQIAHGLHVSPTISRGYLILFNPAVKHKMFIKSYTRMDLKEEIATIKQIEGNYLKAVAEFLDFDTLQIQGVYISEAEIIAELQAKQFLNP